MGQGKVMHSEIRSALKEHFGHETFIAGQEEVIGHLLGGRSAAAVFPTGGGERIVLPGRTHTAIEKTAWDRAVAVREEHREFLSSPRVFTRWLCGVTSPALTRSKLSGNPLFGAFSNVPFQVVLEKSAE
jgi:hypothetical protein